MEEQIRKTQRDGCYKQLRRRLMHGQIAAGERLTESVWSERFGVTRGSLREAMSMLLHEGLLTRGKGGGFFVPVMTHRDLKEVQEARIAIEVGALRLVGIINSPVCNLTQMRETCKAMSQMLESDFELGFVEADRRFHEQLVETSCNERLKRIYSQAPLPLMPPSEPDKSIRREQFQKTLEQHFRICDSLAEGNINEACELLEQHLLISRRLTENIN